VTWKNTGKLKFYREIDFHPSVWSWNNKKTKTFSSTGADIVNCLPLNEVYIYFAFNS